MIFKRKNCEALELPPPPILKDFIHQISALLTYARRCYITYSPIYTTTETLPLFPHKNHEGFPSCHVTVTPLCFITTILAAAWGTLVDKVIVSGLHYGWEYLFSAFLSICLCKNK